MKVKSIRCDIPLVVFHEELQSEFIITLISSLIIAPSFMKVFYIIKITNMNICIAIFGKPSLFSSTILINK